MPKKGGADNMIDGANNMIDDDSFNLIQMQNELKKVQAQKKIIGKPDINQSGDSYGFFDIFTDKSIPTKTIQIHNPTMFAVVTSVIYLLIHIIVYKQTEFESWKIFSIIFVWPIVVEILSRNLSNYLYIPWLLSVGVLILFISYTIYKFRKAIKKEFNNKDYDDDYDYDDDDNYDYNNLINFY